MKKKRLIIPIIIVILIGLLVLLSIFVIYPKFIKKTDDKYKKLYNKYPNIKWSETSEEMGINKKKIKISNGKLECDVEYQSICDVANNIGINISKITAYGDYQDYFYLLSDDGKAYKITSDYYSGQTITQILKNYKFIDMTKIYRSHKMAWSNIEPLQEQPYYYDLYPYFLTSDGKLISEYEYTYEEENRDFIGNRCFWYYGIDNIGLLCLYYNSEGYLSYRGESRPRMAAHEPDFSINYKEMKNNIGQQIVAKYIYDEWVKEYIDFRKRVLVIDENDDLYAFEYINDTFVTSYIGKVKAIDYDNGVIKFTLTDDKEYNAYTISGYLDVAMNTTSYFDTE